MDLQTYLPQRGLCRCTSPSLMQWRRWMVCADRLHV